MLMYVKPKLNDQSKVVKKKGKSRTFLSKAAKRGLLAAMPIALLASHLLGYTPLYLLVLYLIFSAITYLLYAKDKRAAKQGKWRVKENTLHFFALIGGWPGAIVAQEGLRHKTQKKPFRIGFWTTVALNLSAFALLHTPAGLQLIQSITRNIEYFTVHHVNNNIIVAAVVYLTEYRDVF